MLVLQPCRCSMKLYSRKETGEGGEDALRKAGDDCIAQKRMVKAQKSGETPVIPPRRTTMRGLAVHAASGAVREEMKGVADFVLRATHMA